MLTPQHYPATRPFAARATLNLGKLAVLGVGRHDPAYVGLHVYVGGKVVFSWNNDGVPLASASVHDLRAPPLVIGISGPTILRVAAYVDHSPGKAGTPWEKFPFWGRTTGVLGQAFAVVEPQDGAAEGVFEGAGSFQGMGFLLPFSYTTAELPADDPLPRVVGIEVTQAIQHFWSEHGRNNTLPLVQEKPTLVRVFLESGLDISKDNGQIHNVTGRLTVLHPSGWSVTTHSLEPVTIGPSLQEIDRGQWRHSLNFWFFPKAAGQLSFLVTVDAADKRIFGATSAAFVPPPPPIDILVYRFSHHYQDPGGPSPRKDCGLDGFHSATGDYVPEWADCQKALIDLASIMPVPWPWSQSPPFSVSFGGTNHGFAKDGNSLRDDASWANFVTGFARGRTQIGSSSTVLGFISESYRCLVGARAGWHQPGTGAIASVPDQLACAHELAHRLGQLHARGCGASNPVPTFVPLDARITEVGVDVWRALTLFWHGQDPQKALKDPDAANAGPPLVDIMSYCSKNRWISPYTWWSCLHRLQNNDFHIQSLI